jgi:hypothetical protein
VTELELATAAFAVLNIIMYVLWWDKPLDVECPIRVRRRRGGSEEANEEQHRAQEESESPDRYRAKEWNWQSFFRGWSRDNVWNVVKPFYAMIGPGVEDDVFSVVGDPERYDFKTAISLFIGGILVIMVFGGIHCIGWSFDFPSHTEQLLWRISSIAITGIPLDFVVIATILVLFGLAEDENLAAILYLFHTLLYILSRVLLLVISLTTLRSLPSTAFQTVQWTTFLPHI